MRLACRLINGDGFAFEYATIDLTPDYAAWLLRLVAEAKKLNGAHDTFYAVELFDSAVEYGSALDSLNDETNELIDSDGEWVQVPDNHRWPDDCLQSTSAATVVVTDGSIHWRAAAKHGDNGTYFETATLTVAELREMFPPQVAEHGTEPATETPAEPQRYILYDHDMGDLATTTVYASYEEAVDDASQLDNVIVLALPFVQEIAQEVVQEVAPVCECEQPGHFRSGVPGILARVENGRLAEGAKVERCDFCRRYPSDKAAFEKLVKLGIASRETVGSTLPLTLPHAKQYIDAGGGFCPNCQSHQTEGDSVDFDGRHCTQRMRCLDCDAVWFDAYTLSSLSAVSPVEHRD